MRRASCLRPLVLTRLQCYTWDMNSERSSVVDQPDQERYALLVDGETAGIIEYQDLGDSLRALVHTEVGDAYQGKGLGRELVGGALRLAEEDGLSIIPRCPMVQAYIQKKPEHAHLVPGERRAEFGL